MTDALNRNYVVAPAGVELYETVQLDHTGFSRTWFITSHPKAFTATLETGNSVEFTPLPFSVQLPKIDGAGHQDLAFAISNVGLEMSAELEGASQYPLEQIKLTYRVYSSDDLAQPGAAPIHLTVDTISVNDEAIVATANRADVLNRKFPSIVYTIEMFPGLNRA